MKKITLVLGLCWVMSGLMSAQNYANDFGKFNLNEVTMTAYDLDKAAEAVVLYDLGNTYFIDNDDGFRIIFERSTKIKILSKAGLDYAQVEIPFYVENNQIEQVYDIEGYTYNIENSAAKISNLNAKNSFEEKISEHWVVKKFAMPDVKEGSVIEYRYKVISPYFFNFHDWEFQSRIPVAYSEYTVRMIPFYEYSWIFQGASKFDIYKNTLGNIKERYGSVEYQDNIYTFGMKNIPAFRDEDYITSINDYIMKMDFQLSAIHYPNGTKVDIITTWPLLIKELMKTSEFGTYMKSMSNNSGDIINTLALEPKTMREKAEIIFNYVKSNYNWSGTKDKFAGKTAKAFLKAKNGNSADINLFLSSMLNAAGVKAYPVLISTRDHGKIAVKYPFQQFMNYVIVLVRLDNEDILLDATEPLSSFGMLPARCINEKGLVVNDVKEEWIQIADKTNSELTDSIYITINETLDSSYVDLHIQAQGHVALDYRRAYQTDGNAFKKNRLVQGMESRKEITMQNETDIDKPLIFDYAVVTSNETVGDNILVSPFQGLAIANNPLKVGFRSYPVDMTYATTNNFVSIIDIPKGYKFVDQNKSIAIDNALVSIQYKIENNADKLKIIGSYNFKKAVYLPHEYYDLKYYFTKIVETFNDKIVFAKNI